MAGHCTPLEEALLLGLILAVSLGPFLATLIFGGGSPIEVGLGSAVSVGASVAVFRLALPTPKPVDRDDDDVPKEGIMDIAFLALAALLVLLTLAFIRLAERVAS